MTTAGHPECHGFQLELVAGDVVPGVPGVVAAHLRRLRLPLHGRVLAEETGDDSSFGQICWTLLLSF